MSNKSMRFDNKVVVVTGAGGGLGKAYALLFASRGAKVVVNDLGSTATGDGNSTRAADAVVKEIKDAGGQAVANYNSVEDGEAIIKTALDNFGSVDIVINNAGILRDKTFQKMTDSDWDIIFKIHVKGSYSVTKAAWEHMKQKGFGRIIFTTSSSGIYGNFGQSNYSAAKLALVGLANTLALEGAKYNVFSNTIAPMAGSRLTENIMPPEMVAALKPEFVSPLVAYLCHESTRENGGLFEVGAGWISRLRWQRTKGALLPVNKILTIEDVRDNWETVNDWKDAENPKTNQDSMQIIMSNLNNKGQSNSNNKNVDVRKVEGYNFEKSTYSYSSRDVALYALSIGAAAKDALNNKELSFVYENSSDFKTIPSFGVIFPSHVLTQVLSIPGLKFDPMMLLHGEHFLEVKKPLPTSANIVNSAKVRNIYDKGSGALLIIDAHSRDQATGEELCHNEFSLFIRGIGGFNKDNRGPTPKPIQIPQRAPDATVREKTNDNQALYYRLNGDFNPLHADPAMAGAVGFKRPILHGLCTFGIATRAVLATFCDNDVSKFKNIRVRFSKHVFPSETIETQMWKVSPTQIIFQCKVVERNEICLSNAMIEIYGDASSQSVPKTIPVASNQQPKPAAAAPAAQKPSTTSASLNVEGFKASELFNELSKRIAADASLVSKVNGVIQFDVVSDSTKATQSWTIDLKNGKGSVSLGPAQKPDCTLGLTDQNFCALMQGQLNPQNAFMQGKLKLKGNLQLATKLELLMKQIKSKL